jgi:hypothetical protein
MDTILTVKDIRPIKVDGGRCKFYMNSDMAQGDSPKNGA